MSSSSWRRSSISEQPRGGRCPRGRCRRRPARCGTTVSTISSASSASRQIGKRATPREFLEQQRLALHHRQRGLRADAADAEHRRAVGDHGHGVRLDRVRERPLGVLGDRGADARHAGRVGHRQVVGVFTLMLRPVWIFPPRWSLQRPGLHLPSTRAPRTDRAAEITSPLCSALAHFTVSRRVSPFPSRPGSSPRRPA